MSEFPYKTMLLCLARSIALAEHECEIGDAVGHAFRAAGLALPRHIDGSIDHAALEYMGARSLVQWARELEAATDRPRTLEDAARILSHRRSDALDDAAAALLRAGVPVDQLEIVHETGSRTDEPWIIHTRTYVRARPT